MSRPAWCPHADCQWMTGGGLGDAESGSGGFCGGKLPAPEPHGASMNTHRICLKQSDMPPIDLQVNSSDLWYLGRMLNGFRTMIQEPPNAD